MANYDSNYAIAQLISARLGNSPIPFDSVYSICLLIYQELGGVEQDFDSVYSILLEILPLVDGGIASKVIDDTSIRLDKTWSSSKIASELANAGFQVEIVTELPSVGDPHTIYFILKSDSSTGDVYDEWMYIDGNWEKVGNTAIDLSDYAKISDVDASLALKQDVLTAGQNIAIDTSNNISALGYIWDASYGSTATIFRNLPSDGGELAVNVATNYGAHAEGCETTATGEGAHAEGAWGTIASGNYSHAEGGATQATESGAHAEGQYTIASGKFSHAEGYRFKSGNVIVNTTAIGNESHAEGLGTIATGRAAHTEGALTQALNDAEHAEGIINLSHKVSSDSGDAGNTRHSVGIGYYYKDDPATLYRTNAVEIMGNGDQYIIGVGGYQGTDTKVQNASIKTVQEVINAKADAYEVATLVDIEALFAMPTFYIDSSLYKTYGNLNWAQWLSSKYNTNSFTNIYNASSYDSTIEPLPEVDSSAYPVQNGQYYSTCEDTYVPATAPADDEIWYTTESGNLWEPYVDYGEGAENTLLKVNNGNVTILSNNYVNGHGVIKYSEPITSLDYHFGFNFYDAYTQSTDLTTLTLPNSITSVDDILNDSAPELEAIYYNGTVAECEEIDWDSFGAVFIGIEEIICLDGTYSFSGGGSGSGSGGSGSGNG